MKIFHKKIVAILFPPYLAIFRTLNEIGWCVWFNAIALCLFQCNIGKFIGFD